MIFQCGKWDAPFNEAMGEAFCLATGGDVGEPDFVGQSGHEIVTPGGEFGSDAIFIRPEARENKQASIGQRLPPFRSDALWQGAGRTEDDGLRTPQQDTQTFFLNRRMEAADDATPGVTPTCSLVVGPEDDTARTTGGAEERGLGQSEQVEIAERPDLRRGGGTEPFRQQTRPTGIV